MNLFFDLRLRYFVNTPGLDDPLNALTFKAGDGEELVVQFGRSPDSTTSAGINEAPNWTSESLAANSTITLGIKASGDFSDGDLLAGTSTFTHDATEKTYTFELDLNTTEINTALQRGDADDTDDVATITDALFEMTFKVGGTGKPRSSIEDILVTIKHDVLYGDEGTPASANDPDDYVLSSAIESEMDAALGNTDWKTKQTDEYIQDLIAAMFSGGTHTSATVTYDDSDGTLDIAVTGGGGGLDEEQVEDVVGALVAGGTGINASYDDGTDTLTISLSGEDFTTALKNKPDAIEANATADQTGTEIAALLDTEIGNSGWRATLTDEYVQDLVAAMFSGGTHTNATVTYDDSDGSLDIAASASSGGEALTKTFTITGHSFSLHDLVRWTDTNELTAFSGFTDYRPTCVVSAVDGDDVTVTLYGEIEEVFNSSTGFVPIYAATGGSLSTVESEFLVGYVTGGVGINRGLFVAPQRNNTTSAIDKIVDLKTDAYSTETSATTPTVPYDDTPPTSSEGTEINSITHTASDSSNKIILSGVVNGDTNGNRTFTISLFDGSTLIASFLSRRDAAHRPQSIPYYSEFLPGDTSSHTYTVRVGAEGGTWYINTTNAGNKYDGNMVSTLELKEVAS